MTTATTALRPWRRRDYRGNHYYEWADSGERIPGVTTIIGKALAKPALIEWASRTAATTAADSAHLLDTELQRDAWIDHVRTQARRTRDAAASIGSGVHTYAQHIVSGEPVAVPDLYRPFVEQTVDFMNVCKVNPWIVETPVLSRRHNYAGTLDLVAGLVPPGESERTWLLDYKTSQESGKRRAYPDVALQLAAYRHADVYRSSNGDEYPMPALDGAAVVVVYPDGWELIPVVADEPEFMTFRALSYVAAWVRATDEYPSSRVPDRRIILPPVASGNASAR